MQQVTTVAMMNIWMKPFLSKISSNAVRISDFLFYPVSPVAYFESSRDKNIFPASL